MLFVKLLKYLLFFVPLSLAWDLNIPQNIAISLQFKDNIAMYYSYENVGKVVSKYSANGIPDISALWFLIPIDESTNTYLIQNLKSGGKWASPTKSGSTDILVTQGANTPDNLWVIDENYKIRSYTTGLCVTAD